MAFTGDLEHLSIFDIIQLLNTTRKSGTFSVKGSRGESRIIFSNGYIVGASHLNNKVRIGSVLVKMTAITIEDLEKALQIQKNAGAERKPLIATLLEMGKLKRDDATKGLKKLIQMTIVELVGWRDGVFTLDTEAIHVSPECSYPISKMEQEISLDAQVVLMDALRIYDEQERDRQSGKIVPADEELFADVVPYEETVENLQESPQVTVGDLGLEDLDHLERKMPQSFSVDEIFDPLEIHRQVIKETLPDFPVEDQETLVSFLKRSTVSIDTRSASTRKEGKLKAVVLVSDDELVRHSLMTICKDEGILVFPADRPEELDRVMNDCAATEISPIVAFDSPGTEASALSFEKIAELRRRVREGYPQVPVIQMFSLLDYDFALQAFEDDVRAVFPKPSRESRGATFVKDTIAFLETFNSYIRRVFGEKREEVVTERRGGVVPDAGDQLGRLKRRIIAFRDLSEPSAVSLAFLHCVAEVFERSITFIVRHSELTGEKAIGVYAEKEHGATPATGLKIPLSEPSVFHDIIENGKLFYGETSDQVLKTHLLDSIGTPLRPVMVLIPMKTLGKTVTLTYGDFGEKEAAPMQADILEILANEAGLVLENVLCRKKLAKAPLPGEER
jgi:hypothetical protein